MTIMIMMRFSPLPMVPTLSSPSSYLPVFAIYFILISSYLHHVLVDGFTASLNSFKKSRQILISANRQHETLLQRPRKITKGYMSSNNDDEVAKAKEWLKRAQEIRESIPDSNANLVSTTTNDDDKDAQKKESYVSTASPSQWNVPDEDIYNDNPCVGYRLYVDIGREEGTWMDYQW